MPRPAARSKTPALRVRVARRGDIEGLTRLAARSYRVSSVENRREFYTAHPRFALSDVRVGELGGDVVASLVLYPLTAWVRGAALAVAGVGSVAVSPEHRRRGLADQLLRAALRELARVGPAFSMLYAWRGSYYRKLGWGVIEHVHPLAVAPANLPLSNDARRIRLLAPADRPAIEALYERVARRGHFALARPRAWWRDRLWTYPGDWVVYEARRGVIEGYLHYEVDAANGPFKLALAVDELIAATPAAHAGLVGYLASLADQVAEIQHAAPGDAAWPALLATPQNLHPTAEIGLFNDTGGIAAGAMLRVVDVPAGLAAFPVARDARGEVGLEVDDPVLRANARAFRVAARDGRLTVRPLGRRAPGLARLAVPAEHLGPILAGTLAPTRAAEVGLIESAGGAEVVESWFRTRPAFLHPLNGF